MAHLTVLFLRVLKPGRFEKIAGRMRKVLAHRIDETRARDLAFRWQRYKFEIQMGQIRGIFKPKVFPRIEVSGMEHLSASRDKGRGSILWVMATAGPVLYKQGLWQAGVPVVHLSSMMHGAPKRTSFSVGTIAPLRRRAENPLLAERVVIPLDGSLNYLVTLKERLAANACVTIHGEYRGRQNIRAPFFGFQCEFAMGAPSLASRSGAELLPVHVERLGNSHYRVVIGEPIRVSVKDRKEFAAIAIAAFAQRLEQTIEAHPELWDGWGDLPPLYPAEPAA